MSERERQKGAGRHRGRDRMVRTVTLERSDAGVACSGKSSYNEMEETEVIVHG